VLVEWLKVKALSSSPSSGEKKKRYNIGQAWENISVIPATREAEIRRIEGGGQWRDLTIPHFMPNKSGLAVYL
jgi:hypothetical protein